LTAALSKGAAMSKTTIDHDEIKQWAESHGGVPAAVDRTHEDGGDVGIIRLMFPKSAQSEHGALVEISWDEFFEQFDEAELALIYDDNSLFNKLIGRDTADKRAHGDNKASRHADRKTSGSAKTGAKAKAGTGTATKKSEAKPKAAAAKSVTAKSTKAKSAEDGGGKAATASKAKASTGRKKADGGGDAELKSREYTGPDGKVHHHTRAYMEKHG
jgi:hypothetical protein